MPYAPHWIEITLWAPSDQDLKSDLAMWEKSQAHVFCCITDEIDRCILSHSCKCVCSLQVVTVPDSRSSSYAVSNMQAAMQIMVTVAQARPNFLFVQQSKAAITAPAFSGTSRKMQLFCVQRRIDTFCKHSTKNKLD